jgi:glycine/D-amino acid oxidase-like deaminating enzyme/nitrite reductase/ring-hydroxylating ferredoxin subunit
MASLWFAHSPRPETDPFPESERFDVVVVGAGLTGLCAGLLLARAGKRVAVLEGRHVGALATGNTTAKVSLLQGTRFSQILKRHSLEVARAYLTANRAGQEWIVEYCHSKGIEVEQRDAYSYACSEDAARQVEEEVHACRAVGLPADRVETLELPFRTLGAVRLREQYQIHPVQVLNELCRDFRAQGGRVVEDTRVTSLKTADWVELRTRAGSVFARQVIIAAGFPVLNRSAYFSRLEAHRSYAMAVRTSGDRPRGMYLSIDSPTRSLRTAQVGNEELLIVGGNDHIVGREASPRAQLSDLKAWAHSNFGRTEVVFAWSAQDYRTLDGLPKVAATSGGGRVLVATGFDKWGMTNGPAAALALTGVIFGSELDWARQLYRRGGKSFVGRTGRAIGRNGAVLLEMARGLANNLAPSASSTPAEGEGVTRFEGFKAVGVCRVAGQVRKISAVCPHMGGILRWNDAELSWDCPLHGSRFSADGRVLEGPAVQACRLAFGPASGPDRR